MQGCRDVAGIQFTEAAVLFAFALASRKKHPSFVCEVVHLTNVY